MLDNINVYIKNSKKLKKTLIKLYVKEDGIYIYKSIFVSKYMVNNFIKENENRIIQAYNKLKVESKNELIFKNIVLYKGEEYNIKFLESNKEKIEIDAENKVFNLYICKDKIEDKEYIKKIIKKFFVKQLKKEIELKVRKYSDKMNVTYNNISIKDNKTNYGSCSSKKNLNFNLRLMQMPEYVSDYIICHEVSHLIHMNHSKDFWNNLSKYYGDYKKAKEWLKSNNKNMI